MIASRCSSSASQREALEDALADLVGGLDVERDAGDDAERAERDDAPSKCASPRAARTTRRPSSSSAVTAVARLPLPSPEPWVAVAIAPATLMWGSEARLCSASPSSPGASSP